VAVVACGLGAGIAASGFQPLNNVAGTLDIEALPWRVAFTPPALLALGAVSAAMWRPARDTRAVPVPLLSGGVLLVAAAMISIFGSDAPRVTALSAVIGVVAPVLLLVALLRSRLDSRLICGGFLAAVTLLMLRAIAVFLADHGLPTRSKLESAKFTNQPYDFHYYTLGNPDHTGGFLLLPLALALFWALDSRLSWRSRLLLLGAAAVTFGGIVLTYARFATANAGAVILLAVAMLALRRRTRFAASVTAAVVAVGVVLAALPYVAEILGGKSVSERVQSLADGLAALADHPLAGVGLGRFGDAAGYLHAHSSIIQAGAEMGVLGLCALTLLTGAVIWSAIGIVKADGWFGLRPAAAVAVAIYAVHAALAEPASEGLFNGYTAVSGLSAAMLLAVSLKSSTTDEGTDT
jgi:O-antigen ligase